MKGLVLTALALTLLCGCSPNAREPDNLALVRVLGVDGASPVTLTAVCGGVDQQDASRGSCQEETFGLARDRMPWVGEEELALTSVSHLLVGRDADLAAVLFAVLEDQEMGASARVWLAEEGAAAALEDCKDPAAALELLVQQGVQAPTVAETLGALMTDGSAILPVVGQEGGRLIWRGEERWDEQ
ncbi:MAG: hypothetical protein IJ484_06755 [Oscillospiraceae bacterium]|nr:hypothetical protein [Oscillospiraceae bacterium]